VAAVRAVLEQDGARVVTLTGPGGAGKTRLGLQVGAELVERFADGVWFVPLAAITDPNLVVPAIAQPLGVREVAGEPLLTALQEYLRPKHALLLLDNFEHLVAAAPAVAALLTACPKVQALVTSRQPLRIAGEKELPVPPLALPTERQARTLASGALLDYPAIRLFVARAQAIKPDFTLSEATAPDIVAICRRLDGLPLAIELAAARVRVLAPAQLLTRLDQRLKVLTGGQRDLPARQQTLRAAIEWSHDLLAPAEQALFARLAVFSGGCTFEAAEAVCDSAGDLALDIDVLDGLDSLTLQSLLRMQDGTDGSPRFTMLETIREFGLERLEASGDADTLHRTHADFFLALAEEAEPELTGPDQIAWLDRLDSEHDNLRAALGWLERGDDRERQLRLAAALWRFWWMRGYLTEGRAWLDRALADAVGLPLAIQARARGGAGILAESQGDYERATTLHEDALAAARQLGDQIAIATSLTDLGSIARFQGEYRRAAELHEQALSIWRELNDERGTISSLHELGWLALDRGDYPAAEALLTESLVLARRSGELAALGTVLEKLGMLSFYREEYEQAADLYQDSLDLWRELQDTRMIASLLANLGEVRLHQGDLNRAETMYQKSLSLFRDLEDRRVMAFALCQLGKVALVRDDLARAEGLFYESLALSRQVDEQFVVIESLEGLATAACGHGDQQLGIRLFAAAEALRLALEASPAPSSGEDRERCLSRARRALGEVAFNREWTKGEELSLDEAIAEARGKDRSVTPTAFRNA
jgi:predicted ATPase/Tfp pilus assembly protein PilF